MHAMDSGRDRAPPGEDGRRAKEEVGVGAERRGRMPKMEGSELLHAPAEFPQFMAVSAATTAETAAKTANVSARISFPKHRIDYPLYTVLVGPFCGHIL